MTDHESKRYVEELLHAMGETRDPHQFWKGEPPVDRVIFWQKQMSWYVWAPQAGTEDEARKFGLKLQKKLIGRRNLPSSVPYLHNRWLYVGWVGGIVHLEPAVSSGGKRRAGGKPRVTKVAPWMPGYDEYHERQLAAKAKAKVTREGKKAAAQAARDAAQRDDFAAMLRSEQRIAAMGRGHSSPFMPPGGYRAVGVPDSMLRLFPDGRWFGIFPPDGVVGPYRTRTELERAAAQHAFDHGQGRGPQGETEWSGTGYVPGSGTPVKGGKRRAGGKPRAAHGGKADLTEFRALYTRLDDYTTDELYHRLTGGFLRGDPPARGEMMRAIIDKEHPGLSARARYAAHRLSVPGASGGKRRKRSGAAGLVAAATALKKAWR